MINYNELKELTTEELTSRLIVLDEKMMEYHRTPEFMAYMKNSGNINADNWALFNLCLMGLCAFKKITLHQNNDSLYQDIVNDPKKYLDSAVMPKVMKVYYYQVFKYARLEYLNEFIERYQNRFKQQDPKEEDLDVLLEKLDEEVDEIEENGYSTSKRKVKATADGIRMTERQGRSYSDSEAAFASVLVLPAMLALVYIAVVVIYFVFFYGG